jgi:hypothetical protein
MRRAWSRAADALPALESLHSSGDKVAHTDDDHSDDQFVHEDLDQVVL